MSTIMRACLLACLLLATACGDDDDHDHSHDAPGEKDAGGHTKADAGTAVPAGRLARPELPRPPTRGLPAELRPPR